MKSSPLSALAHYRLLPQTVPLPTLLSAAIARIPYAMIPLGTMSSVTVGTESITTGSIATGIVSFCAALAAPIHGRISDIISPRTLLIFLWPLSSLSTGALLLATVHTWQDWRLWSAAAATGLTMLPIGAFTRARWAMSATSHRTLTTAFSYESMIDELMFVIGPMLVGISSALLWWAPLASATLLITIFVGSFALSTPPTLPQSRSTENTPPPIFSILTRIWPTIGIMASVGALFGSTQAALTERAITLASPSQAGLWYALMGIGSAFIALFVVIIPERFTPAMRIIFPSATTAALLALAAPLESLPTTGALLTCCGLGIGIVLVTTFSTAEHLAPQGGLAVAMTAMPAAITVGVSLGSVIGGRAATMWGSSGAFYVSACASVCAALSGLALVFAATSNRVHDDAPNISETR